MRAGCFAEPRVIRLVNRRFVPFFFNTSGMGLGDDDAAVAFVEDKLENPYAYLSAFDPNGTGPHLASSALYATKDEVFEFLTDLLAEHPEMAAYTDEEEQLLAAAREHADDPDALLAAAELHEDLGCYDEARRLYRCTRDVANDARHEAAALRALLRIARYEADWTTLAVLLDEGSARSLDEWPELADDLDVERGYLLLSRGEHAEMRRVLEARIAARPQSKRTGELRFYAGVASYFLGDSERAEYHWCWVNENIPEDHLARRCYIAAARKAMPYANPELGGYSREGLIGGSIPLIKEAYAAARARYARYDDAPGSEEEADASR
jgi:hypothetical protein